MFVFVSGYHLTYSSSDWRTLIITSELQEIYDRKKEAWYCDEMYLGLLINSVIFIKTDNNL